jgi:hypothetical protein
MKENAHTGAFAVAGNEQDSLLGALALQHLKQRARAARAPHVAEERPDHSLRLVRGRLVVARVLDHAADVSAANCAGLRLHAR